MANFLSAGILVSEIALTESNGLASAIRIADVLYRAKFTPNPTEPMLVQMHVLAWARFPIGSRDAYDFSCHLIRPDGRKSVLFEQGGITVQNVVRGAMPAVNFISDRLTVLADQTGVHTCEFLINGNVAASTHFVILDLSAEVKPL